MNREEIYNWIMNYETRCVCGEKAVYARDFEYATTLLAWLEGEEIRHLGILGCCPEYED